MLPAAFRRLFDFRLTSPSLFRDEIAERSARLGAAYASLACFAYGVVYAIDGPAAFVPANFGVAVVLALLARWPLRSASRTVFAVVNLALGLLAFQTIMVGNLMHAAVAWLMVPSVAVIMIGMRGLGIYLVAASALVVLGVEGGRQLGLVVPRVRLVNAEWQFAFSVVGAQLLVLLIGLIILRARDRLVAEIRERSRELAQALAHASAARAEAEASRNEAMAARNEALAAGRAKEQFFANLTHEIRTPLAGVVGSATLLERGAPREDQRALVDALGSSARELAEVVDAMLDHAKLSVGHFASEPVTIDLPEMIASLRGLFEQPAARRGLALRIALEPGTPPRVRCDRMALRRILVNLLGNAIKFTDAGSVSLRLSVDPVPEGAMLHAEVADSGIGIAPENLAAIFEAFVQADASITRRFGGTGLGLAISRRLAELLGGELSVRSVVGEGSVFTLRLPVDHPPTPDHGADAASGASAGGPVPPAALAGPVPVRRLLVVEDNAINRLLAAEMLGMLGSRVVLAEDGRQALERLGDEPFDLILMDLQMPGMDGIEATRAIRERETRLGLAPTPIVALTGNSASDYGEACAQAGMNGFLVKPVSLESLESLLRAPPRAGDAAVTTPSSRGASIGGQ
jgi:signal transduction histidine kinase/ActR/RegA family two-component response regulator